MPLELTFFQPFAEPGSNSVLVVALGNKSLGCRNEQASDQQSRENDSRPTLSCLRGEQQHDLAKNTTCQPGRRRGNQRHLQTFVMQHALIQLVFWTGNCSGTDDSARLISLLKQELGQSRHLKVRPLA